MAYTVHNFEQGDVLYAEQLNEMDAQIAANEESIENSVSPNMLAEDYSANKTYSIGDYVIYNNELYTCIYEITAAEGWNAAHWESANLGDGISDLNRQLSDVEENQIPELKSALYDKITYVGKGNTYSEYTYDGRLRPGHSYRVYVKLWDTTGITVTTGYMFRLGYTSNGTTTYLHNVYGNDASVLKEFYDVNIPDNAVNPMFAVGGRATGIAILGVENGELALDSVIRRDFMSTLNMEVSRNLIGPDLDVLYPVPPLKSGDVVTISAFDPSKVNTWSQIRFHASDGTQIKYYQFDDAYATTGRTIRLDIGEATAHYISLLHDCGSPLMVERGTKTNFIPHYTTNYEKYLNSNSNFGEFELFLPDQAEIIRNNLSTARMAKRLCFGHVSDAHSSVYPFICSIIDSSDAKFIVNTGDLVQDKYTDGYTNLSAMINAMTKPHYITLGNHDVYQAPSTSDVFDKYFSPIIAHNGQTSLDKTYYSVDFTDEKIKCIFLDPYDAITDYSASMNTIIAGKMSSTQINWFMGQLDGALSESMHVCVFLHLSPEIVGEMEQKFFDVNTSDSSMVTYAFIADVIDAFIDGTSVTFNYDGSTYTHTFASSGVFVGYFCGHMHCDCIGKLKTHVRQNAFTVARPWQSPSVNDKEGTYRHGSGKWGFSLFNYVTVDPTSRHVSIMRVLQQDTKYGFKRDFVTMRY